MGIYDRLSLQPPGRTQIAGGAGAPSMVPPVRPSPGLSRRGGIDPRIFRAMTAIGTAMATKNPQVYSQDLQRQQNERKQAITNSQTSAWLKRQGAAPELIQMAENGQATQAFQLFNTSKKTNIKGPTSIQEFKYFKKNNPDYKGNLLQFMADKKGKKIGTTVTLADGTVIDTAGNQTKYDQKKQADILATQQKSASSSSNLKDSVALMRKNVKRVGYSGPGESVVNFTDDFLEGVGVKDGIGLNGWNPFGDGGDSAARGVVRSKTMDFILDKVSKTKGAISDSEMRIFAAASAGMSQSKAGMLRLLDIADKIADREIEHTTQMEAWKAKRGSLDGFAAAWEKFRSENPIVTEDINSDQKNRVLFENPQDDLFSDQNRKELTYDPQTGQLK